MNTRKRKLVTINTPPPEESINENNGCISPYYSKKKHFDADSEKRKDNRMDEGISTNIPKQTRRKKIAAIFLQKTYDMLAKAPGDIATWSATGNSFIVNDPKEFANSILPKKMKRDDLLVADEDEGKNHWEFFHEHFIRDRQDLMVKIKRKTYAEPNDTALEEIDRLNSQVKTLQAQVSKFQSQLEEMKNLVSNVVLKGEMISPASSQEPFPFIETQSSSTFNADASVGNNFEDSDFDDVFTLNSPLNLIGDDLVYDDIGILDDTISLGNYESISLEEPMVSCEPRISSRKRLNTNIISKSAFQQCLKKVQLAIESMTPDLRDQLLMCISSRKFQPEFSSIVAPPTMVSQATKIFNYISSSPKFQYALTLQLQCNNKKV